MANTASRTLSAVGIFAAGALFGVLAGRAWPNHLTKNMRHRLRQALTLNEFHLVYQPLVSLTSRHCLGVEALLRWRHHNGNDISPELFIPMAIESGMIEALSLKVIELAALDMIPVLRSRPDFHVGINVPPEVLGRGNLGEAAVRHGLISYLPQVIIEITETGIVDDLGRQAVTTARALRARVAIDDFGTGENGLAQLQDLEIDYIKIDKQFVRKIGCNSPGCKLVDGIVELTRQLGAQSIAEGVETEFQAEYLRNLGVEWGQGWLFAKAMPIAALTAYLDRS